MSLHNDVLEFWFGQELTDLESIQQQASLWWSKDDEQDRLIETRFGAVLQKLAKQKSVDWPDTPQADLAKIIVLDQFSRNIYRGTPASFTQDSIALELASNLVDQQRDTELRPIERTFCYMPFEHSESLQLQEQCIQLFEQLLADVPAELTEKFQGYLQYARQHHEIIEQFGRFPHRNEILGRESTPAEVKFLQQPGSSF